LAGRGLSGDARADVNGDAAHLPVEQLALPRVEARPNLDSELADVLRYLDGAPDRACGSVEACEEAVACHVQLAASPAAEQLPRRRVMSRQEVAPAAVADLHRVGGGIDDVREEDGGQHAVEQRVVRIELRKECVQLREDRSSREEPPLPGAVG